MARDRVRGYRVIVDSKLNNPIELRDFCNRIREKIGSLIYDLAHEDCSTVASENCHRLSLEGKMNTLSPNRINRKIKHYKIVGAYSIQRI
jgi:hypothetical protein